MFKTLWNAVVGGSGSEQGSDHSKNQVIGDISSLDQLVVGPFHPLTIESAILYRSSKTQKRWDCLFPECQLSISASSNANQYQMVLTRVVEEGEEALLSNSDEDICDEVVLLLDVQTQFQREADMGNSFIFKDVSSDESYKLDLDEGCSENEVKTLLVTVARGCFERLFGKAPESNYTASELLEWYSLQLKLEAEPKGSEQNDQEQEKNKENIPINDAPKGDVVFESKSAKLFYFDAGTGSFVMQDPLVKVVIVGIGKYGPAGLYSEYRFCVQGLLRKYTDQRLEASLNLNVQKAHNAIIWNFHQTDPSSSVYYSLSCQFEKAEHLDDLLSNYSRFLYELLNKESFTKVKNEDAKYLLKSYALAQDDVEMKDVYEEDDNEEEDDREEEADREEEEDEEYHDLVDDSPSNDALGGNDEKERNDHLAVAYKHDRSFVVRGTQIGIFRHDQDSGLSYQGKIKDVGASSKSRKAFNPSHVMLHEGDSSLLLLNAEEKDKIYKMDLERGQVVEEYSVGNHLDVKNILPEAKYAQMTPGKTFLGFSGNSLFRIDPRLDGSSQMADGKQYASKSSSGFSSAVTTGAGHIALASDKGDIRLYDRIGIRAKTHLPAFGDAILAIDSTDDGKYVLATCKTYLMLVKTQNEDASVNGFTKSLGSQKPVPIRMQLKPEHAAYVGEINFTPAKFNIGSSGMEKFIVTSTGPFVITWNFRRVKQGKLFDYTIKQYQDDVVADQFRYDDTRSIVVALPHDVKVADKNSFATPKKLSSRLGRDDIVNSPF